VSETTPGVPLGDVLPDEGDVPDEVEADAVPVPVDELVTVGEMIVGVVVDVPEVHAETARGTSSVRAPQHSAVSLAPNGVPAVAPRTFMDPPPAQADDVLFPAPGDRNRESAKETRQPSGLTPRAAAGAEAQWPVLPRNIRLME
jgi:hypothetical protein